MNEGSQVDGAHWDAARLEALLRNVPGAVYRCSPESDWSMEFISPEIEAICGHPATDFIGSRVRTFASVIHPDDREHVEDAVADGLRRGQPFEIEYRVVHADGTPRWSTSAAEASSARAARWSTWTAR